jgi:hypothetical protein
MLVSKKHAKSPPEKPIKKISKVSHFTLIDPLKDTDDESDATEERHSKVHHPKIVENTARTIKIIIRTKVGDDTAFLKHVGFLKKFHEAPHLVKTLYNKRHETLRAPALEDLKNVDIYNNHFDLHQIVYGKRRENLLSIVIQEYTSHYKLTEIKRQMDIIPYLKENNMKIEDHEWKPEDWNTSLIGFIPKYAPSYFPKEYIYQKMLKLGNEIKDTPEFRIKTIRIIQEVLGKRLVIQVYAIEVRRCDNYQANKVFMTVAQSPEEYVSFRMQRVNEKAFKHAVAFSAQIQSDSRMITLENVTEESFFIYDVQLQSLTDVMGFYHDSLRQVIRIVVQLEDYTKVRKVIQQDIGAWNDMLDPSDVRQSGFPSLLTISSDEYSDSANSQFSGSINSLLSLDLTEFTIFQPKSSSQDSPTEPVSDVTLESYKVTIEMQNVKIEKQDLQIEFLITTIQQLNIDMNNKFERLLQLYQGKPENSPPSEVEIRSSAQSVDSTPSVEKSVKVKPTVKSTTAKKSVTIGNRRT